ncbi:hypothetical protein DNTS_030888, partial [Danionella cerebrum]
MALIKEECEDLEIEEVIVKEEDLEEQTAMRTPQEQSEALSENEEKDDFSLLSDEYSSQGAVFPDSETLETATASCESFQLCERSSSQHAKLQPDIRVDDGEKPYTCQQCGKSYNLLQSYKRHVKLHNGEKPYTCQLCGKSFNWQQSYTRHIRVHTGEKPYSCPQCGKRFSQHGCLDYHMKTHTG